MSVSKLRVKSLVALDSSDWRGRQNVGTTQNSSGLYWVLPYLTCSQGVAVHLISRLYLTHFLKVIVSTWENGRDCSTMRRSTQSLTRKEGQMKAREVSSTDSMDTWSKEPRTLNSWHADFTMRYPPWVTRIHRHELQWTIPSSMSRRVIYSCSQWKTCCKCKEVDMLPTSKS